MNGDERREPGGFSLLEAEGEDILCAGANVVKDSSFKLLVVSASRN